MIRYLINLLIALDQLLGTALGGDPDMTISANAWLWHLRGKRSWPYRLIDTLFFWEERHCYEAFQSERLGKQLPPEARR